MSDDYAELDARAAVGQPQQPDDLYADLGTRASGQEVPMPKESEVPKTGWQHLKDAVSLVQNHPMTTGLGMLENAGVGLVNAAGKAAGRVADLYNGTPNNRSETWGNLVQPVTPAGKEIAELTAEEGQKVGQEVEKVPGVNTPLGQTLKEAVPEALTDVGLIKGAQGLAGTFAARGPQYMPPAAHPLQAVADAESARISAALQRGRAAGMDLPERTVTPTQEAANGIVRQEFNMPNGAPITPKVLDAVREKNYAPGYKAVEEVPKVQLGSAYEDDIANVDTGLIKEKFRPPPGGSLTGARAVELSKYLREKASAYFQEGSVEATEKGQAHWDAAQAVEDAVERRLKATGQEQTAADWDNARVGYAKTYSVQGALDGAGNVVVPKLKSQLIRGKQLSGALEDLATMGAANPEAFKATPMKPTPGVIRKIAAHSAPIVGAGAGSVLGPLGGAAGAAVGQHIGERMLRP